MADGPYSLAIETSSRLGSVSLGRGDALVDTRALPQPQRPPMRSVDLMPTIDRLCRSHGVAPAEVGEVYVSIGPGSFTGMRIAVATAKLLAQVRGVRLVAVPTLEVVAQNAPPGPGQLAVCLNLKRQTVYAGVFEHDGSRWRLCGEPALVSMAELLQRLGRPAALLGDPLPALTGDGADDASDAGADADRRGVTVLPAILAQPRSESVWRLGRALAAQGRTTDPYALVPLYVRPPEAVALWNKRHRPAAAPSTTT